MQWKFVPLNDQATHFFAVIPLPPPQLPLWGKGTSYSKYWTEVLLILTAYAWNFNPNHWQKNRTLIRFFMTQAQRKFDKHFFAPFNTVRLYYYIIQCSEILSSVICFSGFLTSLHLHVPSYLKEIGKVTVTSTVDHLSHYKRSKI